MNSPALCAVWVGSFLALSFPAGDSHRSGVFVTSRCGFVCTVVARRGFHTDVSLAVPGAAHSPWPNASPSSQARPSPAFLFCHVRAKIKGVADPGSSRLRITCSTWVESFSSESLLSSCWSVWVLVPGGSTSGWEWCSPAVQLWLWPQRWGTASVLDLCPSGNEGLCSSSERVEQPKSSMCSLKEHQDLPMRF